MEQQCSVGRFCKLTTLAHRCSITTNPMLQQGITLRLLSRQSRPNCPNPLATAEAMVLWQKAWHAGYVNEHFLPLLSRTQAALLADTMAERLGIRNKWKLFGALWNRKNKRSDYNDALNQRQTLAFQDSLKILFAD